MKIQKQLFISINKYAVISAIVLYLLGVFTPLKYLNPGLIFCFGAGFFSLLHINYFAPRPRFAAHLWLISLFITALTYYIPLQKNTDGNLTLFVLTLLISFIPFIILIISTSDEKVPKKARLKIVTARTVVQTCIFMVWAILTAFCFIKGTRPDLIFWAMFHVFTVALFPVFIGRVLCGWICPNATMQDALFKNMNYKRPVENLPKAIEEQSRTCSMNTGGKVDKRAPLVPATLLMSWFPMFFAETVWDLTPVDWYPITFMYGLIVLSLLFKWRKLCTHFCWLSSYRCLNGHNSLWRIRFNRSKCRNCKKCLAEEACPFYIDIRNQDNEMPATCCLCFSCMEACPFDDVITFRRAKEEKERLKAEAA